MRTFLYKVNNYFRALPDNLFRQMHKEFTTPIIGDASIPNCKAKLFVNNVVPCHKYHNFSYYAR